MEHLTFGRWLKLRRGGLGLTQAQLGEQIGYAGETMRKVEADELRPSKPMAEKLGTALKIAPEERAAFIRFARDEALAELVQVPAQVLPPPPALSPAPSASTRQRSTPRLPRPREPLIGREWELTVLQTLLLRPTVGLVTLTGPGGVGKTRLALQLAANLRDQTQPNAEPVFPAGIYFVQLATIDNPALVLSAIAQALAVQEGKGASLLATLQEYLHDKQLLLVLDNFEQVVSAAPLLSELLQHKAHRWLTGLLNKSTDRTLARAKALAAAGFFAGRQGDYTLVRPYYEESLAIGRQFNDLGYDRTKAALQTELPEAQFTLAWMTAQGWSFAQIVAYALATNDTAATIAS